MLVFTWRGSNIDEINCVMKHVCSLDIALLDSNINAHERWTDEMPVQKVTPSAQLVVSICDYI